MGFEDWEGHRLLRGKWWGIIFAVNNARGLGKYVDLKLTKDDIVKICGIKEGDREYYYGLPYLVVLIRSAMKNHLPDIKVSIKAGIVHIVEKKEKIEKVGIEKVETVENVETIEKKEKINVETIEKKENIEPVEYDKIFDF